MSDDLIERVATAIYKAGALNAERRCDTYEAAYYPLARAAIAIVREAVIEECVAVVMAEGGGMALTPMKLTLADAMRALKGDGDEHR